MCLDCGCGQPEERHGDPASITLTDLRRAAEANGHSLAEAIGNVSDALAGIEADDEPEAYGSR